MKELIEWFTTNPIAANIFASSVAILIIVCIIMYLVAFSQGREVSFWPPKIGEKPHKISQSGKPANTEIKTFKTGEDLIRYVNKRLLQAQVQVDDLSWNPATGLGHGINISQNLYEEYMMCVEHISKNIPYREIFIFNRPERIQKLQKQLAKNLTWYHCAYHQDTKIPLMQFMVIDRSEVIILTDQLATRVAIADLDVAGLFAEYYDHIWKSATPIKEGPTVIQNNLDILLKRTQK